MRLGGFASLGASDGFELTAEGVAYCFSLSMLFRAWGPINPEP